MENTVTELDVREHLSDIIDRVTRSGETLIVERDGKPILRLAPVAPKPATVADLRAFFERNAPPDADFIRDVQSAIHSQDVGIPESQWD